MPPSLFVIYAEKEVHTHGHDPADPLPYQRRQDDSGVHAGPL